jgi:hypothetical protein
MGKAVLDNMAIKNPKFRIQLSSPITRKSRLFNRLLDSPMNTGK